MRYKSILRMAIVAVTVSFFATIVYFYLSSTFLLNDRVYTGIAAVREMIHAFGWIAYVKSFSAMWFLNFLQILIASLIVFVWLIRRQGDEGYKAG